MKPVKAMSAPMYSLMLVLVTLVLVEANISMTYTVDGGDSRPVTSHQNLTTCSGVPVELSVCIATASPGSLLSLQVKDQITSSSGTCVKVLHRFATSQPVECSYHGEEFVFNVNVAVCVSSKRALCDTVAGLPGGVNWIVFQRRATGDVDFYRNWAEYVSGFGNVTGDHWLGLEKIHTLCPLSRPCKLRVDLKDPNYKNGTLVWAEYSSFSLSGSSDNYRLSISGYNATSTIGRDSLTEHNGRAFSTKDKDNDIWPSGNCAAGSHGAWWYGSCHASNLNGKYGVRYLTGLRWYYGNGNNLYATYTEMKIRVLG